MNESYSRLHTSPLRAYLPPRELALVRLETAIALIRAGVINAGIEALVAFIAPVGVVEEDVGLGDDEEVPRLVLLIVKIVVEVQHLRINRL